MWIHIRSLCLFAHHTIRLSSAKDSGTSFGSGGPWSASANLARILTPYCCQNYRNNSMSLTHKKNKLRWYPQQPQRFIFTTFFLQPSPEPSLQPSPERVELDLALHPRFPKPSPGSSLQPSSEPCWTWPLLQSLPDLLQNLQNLLRNLVEPDPAPAPVHTGAILGWRPH